MASTRRDHRPVWRDQRQYWQLVCHRPWELTPLIPLRATDAYLTRVDAG